MQVLCNHTWFPSEIQWNVMLPLKFAPGITSIIQSCVCLCVSIWLFLCLYWLYVYQSVCSSACLYCMSPPPPYLSFWTSLVTMAPPWNCKHSLNSECTINKETTSTVLGPHANVLIKGHNRENVSPHKISTESAVLYTWKWGSIIWVVNVQQMNQSRSENVHISKG